MNNRPFANLNNMLHEKKGDVKVHKSSTTAADAMRKVAESNECICSHAKVDHDFLGCSIRKCRCGGFNARKESK